MKLSLLLLKSGEHLISACEQLEYEPAVHLVDPCTISGNTKLTLSRWPKYTDDVHILFNSEDLLTVVEPNEALTQAYLKKTGKTIEDFTETFPEQEEQQPQVLLQENEQVFDDEYEPLYVEE